MVKVSEKNRHLASYLEQNKEEFLSLGGYGHDIPLIDHDKLAEIIQEFYDEMC